MAGRPLYRSMTDELDKRVNETFEVEDNATHLDYVVHWIESGQTVKELSEELGVTWPFVKRHLERTFGAPSCDAALTRARTIGAHALVDETLGIADAASEDSIGVARLRVATRQWTAEKWNPAFGQKQGANVTINLGSLHLAAISREPNRVTASDAMKALPSSDAVVLPAKCDE